MVNPKIVIVLGLAVFLLLSGCLLLVLPPVWPDEAYLADISLNLLHQGRIGTDLWLNMIPDVSQHFFWYPPVLFFLQADWIKLFGFSILNLRILSLLFSVFFILLYCEYIQIKIKQYSWVKKGLFLFILTLSLVLLVSDNLFLQASKISRPEIYVLTFGMLSILLWEDYVKKPRKKTLIFIGLLLGISTLIHFMSFVFVAAIFIHLIVLEGGRLFRSLPVKSFIISYAIFPLLWLLLIFKYIPYLSQQLTLQAAYRLSGPSWIGLIFASPQLVNQIIILIYSLIGILFIIDTLRKRTTSHIYIVLIIVFSWLYTIVGKLQWYPILIVPFTYTAALIQLSNMLKKKLRGRNKLSFLLTTHFILPVTLLICNIFVFYTSLSYYSKEYNYDHFTKQVLEVIPDKTAVYLSTIPDLYFGFKQTRNNTLYQYPPLPTTRDKYLEVLNHSDYIVINFSPESMFFPNLLNKYIDLNGEKFIKVGDMNQYQAFIIKLKPISQRNLSP